MKVNNQSMSCQRPGVRIGKATLKPSRRHTGGGVVLVEVLRQELGAWLLGGLLRLSAGELGYRTWPTSKRQQRRLKGRARQAAERALQEAGDED